MNNMPELEEREKLARVICLWNDNRLDLFEISQPDEVSHCLEGQRQKTQRKNVFTLTRLLFLVLKL